LRSVTFWVRGVPFGRPFALSFAGFHSQGTELDEAITTGPRLAERQMP
jgi:hypothetical protein